MKGVVSKAWSLITIHNILSVVFLAYIGAGVKSLYELARVPVMDESNRESPVVVSHMHDGQVFDIHLYLTMSKFEGSVDTMYLGNFTNVVYSESFDDSSVLSSSGDVGKLVLHNITLAPEYCGNRTLYLQAHMTDPSKGGVILNKSYFQISQQLIPTDDRDSKHFLWDTSFNATDSKNIQLPHSSIPKKIEIGLIVETRPMDMQAMIDKGFTRYIDMRKRKIMFPVHTNPYITPRDEYLSLQGCPIIDDLEIVYKPIGTSYWMLSDILLRSFDKLEHGSFKMNEYDIDSFKMLVTGSSTLKLVVVYLVSLLHFIFEYLSIKSDLSFWRSKTNFNGISESSISMNVVMGIISALYVIEQEEGNIALYFILIKMFMNLWKIYKIRKSGPKNATSNAVVVVDPYESIHREEMQGMKYLTIVLVPLVIIFCVYRLVYYKFKSWYSWAILSLAAASEVFGFVTMTPQVFLNHRLKSVEHLPWTALTYSFINTFIDDLFAFGIFRVPEVSRYSCLRDDVVFVAICVQRWMYSGRRADDDDQVSATIKEKEKESPVTDNNSKGINVVTVTEEPVAKDQVVRKRKTKNSTH